LFYFSVLGEAFEAWGGLPEAQHLLLYSHKVGNRLIDQKAITSSGEHDEAIKRHRLDNQTASAYLIAMRET
jgi:hypothetical protein